MPLKFNFHENQNYWQNECEISFEKYLLTSKFEKQKESDPSDIYFMISMIFWKKSTLIFTYHGRKEIKMYKCNFVYKSKPQPNFCSQLAECLFRGEGL